MKRKNKILFLVAIIVVAFCGLVGIRLLTQGGKCISLDSFLENNHDASFDYWRDWGISYRSNYYSVQHHLNDSVILTSIVSVGIRTVRSVKFQPLFYLSEGTNSAQIDSVDVLSYSDSIVERVQFMLDNWISDIRCFDGNSIFFTFFSNKTVGSAITLIKTDGPPLNPDWRVYNEIYPNWFIIQSPPADNQP